MLNPLLSTIFLTAMLGCMLASFLVRVKIIAGINTRRAPGKKLTIMNRDFFGILQLHRLLYPKSPLRWIQVLSIVLSMVFGLGFTIIQNLPK